MASRVPSARVRSSLPGRRSWRGVRPGSRRTVRGWRVRVVANRLPALRVESQYVEPAERIAADAGRPRRARGDHRVAGSSRELVDDERGGDAAGAVGVARTDSRSAPRRPPQVVSHRQERRCRSPGRRSITRIRSSWRSRSCRCIWTTSSRARGVRHEQTSRCVFCAVIERGARKGRRASCLRAIDTVAFCPFASRVPFETWILPRRHAAAFDEQSDEALRPSHTACVTRSAVCTRR